MPVQTADGFRSSRRRLHILWAERILVDRYGHAIGTQSFRLPNGNASLLLLSTVDVDVIWLLFLNLAGDCFCSFGKLRSRIHNALHQEETGSTDDWQWVSEDGTLQIDFRDGAVTRRGELIELTPTESRLLTYLASHRGQVVSHAELLTSVWGLEFAEELTYLSVYMRYLCQKLEDDPDRPRYIRAHKEAGYYFTAKRGPSNGSGQDRSASRPVLSAQTA